MIFKLANPLTFQKLADKILPHSVFFMFFSLFLGLYYAFFNSPPDYLQVKLSELCMCVPCAWLSLMIYSIMAICSFISIVFKHTLTDIISRSCAPVGACFATLVTGSIWGKPTGYGGCGMQD